MWLERWLSKETSVLAEALDLVPSTHLAVKSSIIHSFRGSDTVFWHLVGTTHMSQTFKAHKTKINKSAQNIMNSSLRIWVNRFLEEINYFIQISLF